MTGIKMLLVSYLLLIYGVSSAQEELGQVGWLRDYDKAMTKAQQDDKLVLILFQEVPGCVTCRNYGNKVLSHPLLVDALENEFVPLAIYNNKRGIDSKVLEKYNEPSWNNPVIRIVDKEGNPVIDRLSGNYSLVGLVGYMTLALRQESRGVPGYLDLLQQEVSAKKTETAYYQMYCFWSGESQLGTVEGVVKTQPGFMNGAEVVEVKYDVESLQKGELDRVAKQANCSLVKNEGKFRLDKDPQYYLKNSSYRSLPLSDLQKTKINSALAAKEDAKQYLSPSQLTWLDERDENSLYELPLSKAWTLRSAMEK